MITTGGCRRLMASHRVASEFSRRLVDLGSDRAGSTSSRTTLFRSAGQSPAGVWCCRLRDRRWAAAEAVALLPGKLKERDQKAVKRARKRASMDPQARADATPERLKVREFIKRDRMKRLIRPLG